MQLAAVACSYLPSPTKTARRKPPRCSLVQIVGEDVTLNSINVAYATLTGMQPGDGRTTVVDVRLNSSMMLTPAFKRTRVLKLSSFSYVISNGEFPFANTDIPSDTMSVQSLGPHLKVRGPNGPLECSFGNNYKAAHGLS